MHRRVISSIAATALFVGSAVATAAPGPSADTCTPSAGGVTAVVTATTAVLCNGRIGRVWSIATNGPVTTTSLTDAAGRDWTGAPTPDFSIDVDGVSTSSTLGWALRSVTAVPPPVLPGRPKSGSGQALDFRYAVADSRVPSGLELRRLVVLHPGAGVLETRTSLVDDGPVPVRVATYTLDQVGLADPTLPTEVHAYNDGSDWRDDYRHVSQPTGSFDVEGEVLRLGGESGVFLVSQRRGGSMSRVGRDASGNAWVGVEWPRDLFDFGPLQDQPPSYNRLDNPAYPAPIRARLVQPLSTLDLGTSFVGVYDGGAQEAAATFTDDFAGAVEPAFDRSIGLNTFHPWSHGPGMSDANLRTQVDLAKSLGIESFMLDDQWQGGTGGESGDWQWDPARFPDSNGDGVPDFVDYLRAQGLKLGLWMSPLEFNSASQTYAAHPDWACAPVGDGSAQVPDDAGLGVWDATNRQFQQYLLDKVKSLVDTDHVTEFKFDFMAWVDCPPHDYADYEDAFVSLVRRMQDETKDQHVTFELDETNDQRAWPFESAALGPSWFDNMHLHGSTQVAKLLHDVWSASPWIPTWSLGVGALDGTLTGDYAGAAGVDALMPLALLTHITFWTDLSTLTSEQRDEVRWWLSWYAVHRDELGPAVYELTDHDPLDGSGWAAWQPWDGERGYVFAFRQAGGPDTQTLSLHGVAGQTSYTVTDVRSGEVVGTFSGAALRAGLPVTLPPFSAAVYSVVPTAL